MAPKTLLPLPSRKHRIGGWSVDLGFVKSVQSATENILNDIDEIPSLEQVEAVLLAANVQFLRSWQTAGGEIPSGGVEPITGIKKSFNDVWDSVTDFLTQDQIDRIERIHKKDFEKMEDDRFEPK